MLYRPDLSESDTKLILSGEFWEFSEDADRKVEEGQDMGRHRRSAAGRATEVTHAQDAATERHEPGNLHDFAAALEADTPRGRRAHRKQKKTVTPVKTGLLCVSAAVALGTVAVTTGVLPGGDKYTISGGGSSADTVTPATTAPSGPKTPQGGMDGAADRGDRSTSRDTGRETSPSPTPSTAAPSTKPPEKLSAEKPSAEKPEPKKPTQPADKATEKPEEDAPAELSAEAKTEAEVLRLVNTERATAGCNPVAANSGLAKLADVFSEDMAKRDFFDHTDPEGDTPWDRASALGITDLGGENIARGQATAASAMDAWMNSPDHRANILNCDFKTLGVGVHLGAEGPWWTQDFGY